MTRLIRKAARTPDAKLYTPVTDEEKRKIPFSDWLLLNKDTIIYRLDRFMRKTYLNDKQFIALDYLNDAVKSKNRKRWYISKVVPKVLVDPRLLYRRYVNPKSSRKTNSQYALNIPGEYMQDTNLDMNALTRFLKDLLIGLYNSLIESEEWKTLDEKIKANKDDDDLTHLKSPEFRTSVKARIEEDILYKLADKSNKQLFENMTAQQIQDKIIEQIMSRTPHMQNIYYRVDAGPIAMTSWRNKRYCDEFVKCIKEVLNESNTIRAHIDRVMQLERVVTSRLRRYMRS